MSAAGWVDAAGWKVGQRFPALTLPTITGEASLSITEYEGEKVMLHVFASW